MDQGRFRCYVDWVYRYIVFHGKRHPAELGWARFGEIISSQLDRHAYSNSSQELYRSVLRGFYRQARCAPSSVTGGLITDHLNRA